MIEENGAIRVGSGRFIPDGRPTTDRLWNFDIAAAPRDRVIEVCGRLPHATAGFPQYAQWRSDLPAGPDWFTSSYGEPRRLVIWAWRERTGWPQEPRSAAQHSRKG